jgi:hypothetical protein
VWDKHRKAGTGVKRLESKGLESGLETGCSGSRINIRISIDRLSGRLIEVALFLNKGLPAGTCSKLDVWTKNSNCTLVEIELEKLQGAFWSLLPSGSCLSFSRLELLCAKPALEASIRSLCYVVSWKRSSLACLQYNRSIMI